jgi:hypothetical protein
MDGQSNAVQSEDREWVSEQKVQGPIGHSPRTEADTRKRDGSRREITSLGEEKWGYVRMWTSIACWDE